MAMLADRDRTPGIAQRWFARLTRGLRYRPESHYMRGPGPACQRKAETSGDTSDEG